MDGVIGADRIAPVGAQRIAGLRDPETEIIRPVHQVGPGEIHEDPVVAQGVIEDDRVALVVCVAGGAGERRQTRRN